LAETNAYRRQSGTNSYLPISAAINLTGALP
jgi:hypothetical protein